MRAYPECQEARDLIGKPFEVERDLPDWHVIKNPRLRDAALQKIAEVRAAKTKPLTDGLLKWARGRLVWKQVARSDRLHDEQLGGADALCHRGGTSTVRPERNRSTGVDC